MRPSSWRGDVGLLTESLRSLLPWVSFEFFFTQKRWLYGHWWSKGTLDHGGEECLAHSWLDPLNPVPSVLDSLDRMKLLRVHAHQPTRVWETEKSSYCAAILDLGSWIFGVLKIFGVLRIRSCVDVRGRTPRRTFGLFYYYNISKPILMSSSSFSLPFSISNLHHRIYSLLSIQ